MFSYQFIVYNLSYRKIKIEFSHTKPDFSHPKAIPYKGTIKPVTRALLPPRLPQGVSRASWFPLPCRVRRPAAPGGRPAGRPPVGSPGESPEEIPREAGENPWENLGKTMGEPGENLFLTSWGWDGRHDELGDFQGD